MKLFRGLECACCGPERDRESVIEVIKVSVKAVESQWRPAERRKRSKVLQKVYIKYPVTSSFSLDLQKSPTMD